MLGLGALIKYEFKAVGRLMLPLYGAFLAATLLFGIALFSLLDRSGFFGSLIVGLSGFAYFALAVAVVVFTAIILIQRYHKSLLGNEGYLYFTLPVSTNAHIANKTISAAIWLTLGVIVGGISILILSLFAVTPAELMTEIRSGFMEITDFEGGVKVVLIILECLIFALVALGEKALKIYAAISVGHQWSKHRLLGAIGAWMGFTIIEAIIAGLLQKIAPMDSIFGVNMSPFTCMQVGMFFTFIVLAITTVIYWFINYRMLDRHLNLQ